MTSNDSFGDWFSSFVLLSHQSDGSKQLKHLPNAFLTRHPDSFLPHLLPPKEEKDRTKKYIYLYKKEKFSLLSLPFTVFVCLVHFSPVILSPNLDFLPLLTFIFLGFLPICSCTFIFYSIYIFLLASLSLLFLSHYIFLQLTNGEKCYKTSLNFNMCFAHSKSFKYIQNFANFIISSI